MEKMKIYIMKSGDRMKSQRVRGDKDWRGKLNDLILLQNYRQNINLMNSKIKSSGYDINQIIMDGEKVYEYTPRKELAMEFQMCDLFILGKYLRLHHKLASKQKLIFKYESEQRLCDLPMTTDPTVLKNIASIVFFDMQHNYLKVFIHSILITFLLVALVHLMSYGINRHKKSLLWILG